MIDVLEFVRHACKNIPVRNVNLNSLTSITKCDSLQRTGSTLKHFFTFINTVISPPSCYCPKQVLKMALRAENFTASVELVHNNTFASCGSSGVLARGRHHPDNGMRQVVGSISSCDDGQLFDIPH